MPHLWDIFLGYWSVRSGDCPEYRCGQTGKFAVGFFYDTIHPTLHTKRDVRRTHNARKPYRVNAEVIYDASEAWIIDFGIRTYSTRPALGYARSGRFVRGDIHLSISLTYRLANLPSVPPLAYTWEIKRITMVRMPFARIRHPDFGVHWQGDWSKRTMQNIERIDVMGADYTDMHADGGVDVSYILHCQKVDVPPAPLYKRPG